MENNENQNNVQENQDCKCNCKKCMCKIALVTFLGSFLAFYFLMHQTMHHFFSTHKPHKFEFYNRERIDENEVFENFKELKKFPQKEFKLLKSRISPVQIAKYDDAYIFMINLKPFNNDENNIKFDLNGNTVSISGNMAKNNANNSTSYYFTESYDIPEKINIKAISKEKSKNIYIVTVPVENY